MSNLVNVVILNRWHISSMEVQQNKVEIQSKLLNIRLDLVNPNFNTA